MLNINYKKYKLTEKISIEMKKNHFVYTYIHTYNTIYIYMCVSHIHIYYFLCIGIMWPIEGMHPLMKKVTIFMPLTLSVDAFRSMSLRNWNLSHPKVYQGFISILLWIFAAVLITILSLKFKQGIKPKK